ncbi:MAG: hypothetical protein AB7R89_04855 [Dehalococcoidia bacterium]
MTETNADLPQAELQKSSRRGTPKLFPTAPFEEVVIIARTIAENAPGNQMRRLLVFDKLKRSPDSGPSRQLVTNSGRYGLTTGGYQAEYLGLTDLGVRLAAPGSITRQTRQLQFEAAVERIEVFAKLYERLKGKRVPSVDLLEDEASQIGVEAGDRKLAVKVFVANARFLGLIKDVAGGERFISMEQAAEDLTDGVDSERGSDGVEELQVQPVLNGNGQPTGTKGVRARAAFSPSVHVDVQIHIDPSASAEQIDQIFSSMARHLNLNPESGS